MISEGSCETEDWSDDAGNSALPSQDQMHPVFEPTPNLFPFLF